MPLPPPPPTPQHHLALRRIKANDIPASEIDTVQYPGPGYAIFMQGGNEDVSVFGFAKLFSEL
jgi:hypothetical protein